MKGDIVEVMYFDRPLTNKELRGVERYFDMTNNRNIFYKIKRELKFILQDISLFLRRLVK